MRIGLASIYFNLKKCIILPLIAQYAFVARAVMSKIVMKYFDYLLLKGTDGQSSVRPLKNSITSTLYLYCEILL